MNSLMQQLGQLLTEQTAMRDEMLDLFSDDDLKHTLGGDTLSVSALFREMGEVEVSYTQSFKTFKQDFDYRNPDPQLETSKARLRDWHKKLDDDLIETLNGLTEDQIQGQMIDRGGGFMLPAAAQFHTYREAQLIFYGKLSVYLRAMGKPLPQRLQEWVG
jgi:hypothetical protein